MPRRGARVSPREQAARPAVPVPTAAEQDNGAWRDAPATLRLMVQDRNEQRQRGPHAEPAAGRHLEALGTLWGLEIQRWAIWAARQAYGGYPRGNTQLTTLVTANLRDYSIWPHHLARIGQSAGVTVQTMLQLVMRKLAGYGIADDANIPLPVLTAAQKAALGWFRPEMRPSWATTPPQPATFTAMVEQQARALASQSGTPSQAAESYGREIQQFYSGTIGTRGTAEWVRDFSGGLSTILTPTITTTPPTAPIRGFDPVDHPSGD